MSSRAATDRQQLPVLFDPAAAARVADYIGRACARLPIVPTDHEADPSQRRQLATLELRIAVEMKTRLLESRSGCRLPLMPFDMTPRLVLAWLALVAAAVTIWIVATGSNAPSKVTTYDYDPATAHPETRSPQSGVVTHMYGSKPPKRLGFSEGKVITRTYSPNPKAAPPPRNTFKYGVRVQRNGTLTPCPRKEPGCRPTTAY